MTIEQRAIRVAWERFQEGRQCTAEVPKAVIASWERSKSLGVAVEQKKAPLAEEPELFRRRTKASGLIGAARPALEHSGVFLKDACCMMILADSAGFILEAVGDQRVLDYGKRNHLEPGGTWEEVAIGTNAIGTTVAERCPVQICGAEHFCEDVQRWTCAAAPIHHPLGGELLGVVDISGPAGAFSPQSLALAVAIGREIEASLFRSAKVDHEILLRNFVSKRSLWLSEEILVVDRRGYLVHATQSSKKQLDVPNPKALAEEMRRIIGTADPSTWADRCRSRYPNASLEVVEKEGSAVGCLIVLHQRSQHVRPPALGGAPRTAVGFERILGDSAIMRETREKARRLAANTLPILIEGETGVGKELFALAIKAESPFAEGPFVPVNCGGMARDLIASELFGYVRGAFTGADAAGRPGKIEKADGGMLCLDEIGEMPLDLQSYLLRVLEDGVVYRVGGHEGHRVAFRILSMTNRNLMAEVEAGRFRRDLYYRIAAARLQIPPLRERGDDVLLLADRFVEEGARRLGREAPRFSKNALHVLRTYSWPGNVRELRNVVDAILALSDASEIDVEELPAEIRFPAPPTPRPKLPADASSDAFRPGNGGLEDAQREAILAQVEACGGNLTEAARRLGIARSTLYVRLAKYGAPRAPKG